MKIRVLFYKAKRGDGHWLDNAIDVWTAIYSAKNRSVGPYSHVEVFHTTASPFRSVPLEDEIEAGGYMTTSTMRGDDNGSVMRAANEVIQNKARWDVCEIEIGEEEYASLMIYLINEIRNNKGYSKRDCLKFFGLGIFADSKRNICSEISNNALYFADVLEEMGVVSPRRLAYLLVQAGYTIKPLSEG